MYKVQYRASVAKILRRMPRNVAKTVVRKIDQLAVSPYAPNNNVTRLEGEEGYRLRWGIGACYTRFMTMSSSSKSSKLDPEEVYTDEY